MATLSKLFKDFRRRADDRKVPYFIDDDLLTDWFNEAERRACRCARLLIDNETTALTVITLDSAKVEYPLDARVLDVEGARIPERTSPLTRRPYEEIDFKSARNLERAQLDEPTEYAVRDNNVGGAGKRLVIERPPDTDQFTQLLLVVRRLPLTDMATPAAGPPAVDPAPEIDAAYHYDLIWWPLHLYYSSQDADRGGDRAKAQEMFDRFHGAFGPLPSAATEAKRLRHKPTIVAPDPLFRGGDNIGFRRYRPRPDPNP